MSVIPALLLQLEKPGTPVLTIVKGDTAQFVFTYTTSAGVAIDLTGLTSSWDLRVSPAASPLLLGTGAVGGSNGVITVTLTATQTAGLSPVGTGNNSNTFVGIFTLKVADTSSNVKTLEKAQTNLVL